MRPAGARRIATPLHDRAAGVAGVLHLLLDLVAPDFLEAGVRLFRAAFAQLKLARAASSLKILNASWRLHKFLVLLFCVWLLTAKDTNQISPKFVIC